MAPIYFSLTLSIGFWTGILVQRYYLMRKLCVSQEKTRWLTAKVNIYTDLYYDAENKLKVFKDEHAAAEKLVKRELRKRTKKTV